MHHVLKSLSEKQCVPAYMRAVFLTGDLNSL